MGFCNVPGSIYRYDFAGPSVGDEEFKYRSFVDRWLSGDKPGKT